jgi:hypothetical protein
MLQTLLEATSAHTSTLCNLSTLAQKACEVTHTALLFCFLPSASDGIGMPHSAVADLLGRSFIGENVRFGLLADMATSSRDVRFTPESGRRRHLLDVRFVPQADMPSFALL